MDVSFRRCVFFAAAGLVRYNELIRLFRRPACDPQGQIFDRRGRADVLLGVFVGLAAGHGGRGRHPSRQQDGQEQ